ncbi:hypothetical protein [Gracilimonas halophila]|uniref:Uncharacterized protein n=1 Tax=Gracilimonas halophila TaxID=1834464 RepID=A0ABW5JFV5_9BACT
MRTKIFLFGLSLLLLQGCGYEFPTSSTAEEPDLKELNLDRMTIIGSTISAGYMNGALYNEGESHSYGALIDSLLNMDSFTPLSIDSKYGYNRNTGSGILGRFYLSFRNPIQDWPARYNEDGEAISNFNGDINQVTNFSIPGLKSFQIDDSDALSGNTYFDRILDKGVNESLLDLALQQDPTVVLFEPGTEDILGHVTLGAAGEVDPLATDISYSDLTPESVFEDNLNDAINRILNESSSEIFMLNIPDFTPMSYFSELIWYFSPSEWASITTGSYPPFGLYFDFNQDVQEHNSTADREERRPTIVFDGTGGNAFRSKVIQDKYLSDAQNNEGDTIPKYRQMTDDDHFLYNVERIYTERIQNDEVTFGSYQPIDDMFILTKTEKEVAEERREAYNAIIENIAANNTRVHLVDFAGLIEGVNNGLVSYDGVTYSLGFDNKTVVSADGYTLNHRGQALLANEIIKVMNANFGSNISSIDVNGLKGTDIKLDF